MQLFLEQNWKWVSSVCSVCFSSEDIGPWYSPWPEALLQRHPHAVRRAAAVQSLQLEALFISRMVVIL